MAGNVTEALRVTTVGTQVTSGAASSAEIALPVGASGARTKFYRFIAVAGAAHISLGITGMGAATANDCLIGITGLVLDCSGLTHFRHIEQVAATIIQISPVENF